LPNKDHKRYIKTPYVTMTELQTYLIPLILVILTGVLILKPALFTALAETGNETNDQFGSFNDVNQSINRKLRV
jgi:hypothetical protein